MQFIGENQKDSDCVIVATHNASKWQGKVISYAKIERLALKKYRYNTEEGFKTKYVCQFLHDLSIPHREVPMFTMRQLEDRILAGNAVMATYYLPKASKGHMVLLVPGKNRTIEVVNSNMTWIEIYQQVIRKELGIRIWNIGKGFAK